MCERTHKTCGDQIPTLIRENSPQNVETVLELVDTVLAAAQRALRITINRTVGMTPGAMVFRRNMLPPIPVLTDFNLIRQRRQTMIYENNRHAIHDYHIGDRVLLVTYDPTKLQGSQTGPYTITEVHGNGTITILRATGALEHINIRHVGPYCERRIGEEAG